MTTTDPDNGQLEPGPSSRVRRYWVFGLLGIALALLVGYGIAARTGDTTGGTAGGQDAVVFDATLEPPMSAPATPDVPQEPPASATDVPLEPTVSAEVREAVDAFLLRIGKPPSVDILREQPLMSPNSPLVSSTYYRVDGYDLFLHTGASGIRRVVEYGVGSWQPHETPPPFPTSGSDALTDDEMLDLARQLVTAEAGLSADELDELDYQLGSKGTDATFFTWLDTEYSLVRKPQVDGFVPPPKAQVGMTRDGFVFNYSNYLGIESALESDGNGG